MNSERSRVSCLYGPKHMDPWVKRMVSSILHIQTGKALFSSTILERGKPRPRGAKGTPEVTSGGTRGHPMS